MQFAGPLYPEQYVSGLTPTHLIFLANLNRLCATPFANKHNGAINLNDKAISDWCVYKFSARQIKRHLEHLEALGLIKIERGEKVRWVRVVAAKQKSMPFVHIDGLTASQSLVLSKLLDKAAFLKRAELGLMTDSGQMKNLASDLSLLSERSIRYSLQKLKAQNLIIYKNLHGFSHSPFSPVTFARHIEEQYCSLVKIKVSGKCKEITLNRARAIVLADEDNLLTQELAKRNKHRPRPKGCAEKATLQAQAPKFASQSTVQTKAVKKRIWNNMIANKLGPQSGNKELFQLDQKQIKDLLSLPKFPRDLLAKKGTSHRQLLAKKGQDGGNCWQKKVSPSLYRYTRNEKTNLDIHAGENAGADQQTDFYKNFDLKTLLEGCTSSGSSEMWSLPE